MMDILFYTCLTVLSFVSAEGRLIHKNITKILEVIPTENPNPTIRLTRDIDGESLVRLSKEEAVSNELLQFYNRKHKMFSESNPKYVRVVRDSNDNAQRKYSIIEVPNHSIGIEHATVLVKKPIPKFSDLDYDDDFQTKMSKARSVFGDSGDHEDEDFNLDDYDFDVNHDEFLSGRKPLEPRTILRNIEGIISLGPELKTQAKIIKPRNHRAIKREGSAVMYSKESSDYYDDVTTTTIRNKDSQDFENEYSDEGDNSKEGKIETVRSIRSWDVGSYMNKFGDKTYKIMTKLLSVLPMFPQVPNDKNINISS